MFASIKSQLICFKLILRAYIYRNQNIKTMLKPPPTVNGLTKLDKSLFNQELEVPFLVIKDTKLSNIVSLLKRFYFKVENLKSIQHTNDGNVHILLNPQQIQGWSSFPPELLDKFNKIGISSDNLKRKKQLIKFENYATENILRAILPKDAEGTSSFTRMGHIVHLNLREHLLPFKTIIGEVLYNKVRGCRSVVNKINLIDNTYRNFAMEILIGDSDMKTCVKENNCIFSFDFSAVYWNSRLCTEHERIVKKLCANDVLFDVFAGVGPFSVPAAKKRCSVFANDLNPDSFYWLKYNFKLNKIPEEYHKIYNKDGIDFIKQEIKQFLPGYLKEDRNVYITMNLPAMAVEFLNAFRGIFQNHELPETFNSPIIFLYCFVKGNDCIELTRTLVKQHFKCDITNNIVDIFKVRTVSSLKEMMRVTIKLDRHILVEDKKRILVDDNFNKKICIRND